MKSNYDVIIVGGGMIGASLALALAPLPLSIAVIEAVPYDHQQQPSFDDRSIALSHGSALILNALGIAAQLLPQAAAIEHIHVSDRGHLGLCRLHAAEHGVNALGYVIENRVAGNVLYQAIDRLVNLDVLSPARVEAIDNQRQDRVEIRLNHHGSSRVVSARLLVAADGSHSTCARLLKIPSLRTDYQQSALICNIQTSKPHQGWAYERFTETGPLALLPLPGQRYSVVWSVAPDQQDSLMTCDDQAFGQALQQAFGYRAGKIIKTGRRSIYPLFSSRLQQGWDRRVVFVGNALHTGHPVAGQGFNLGLRDIACLAESLAHAIFAQPDADIGADQLLQSYWLQRRKDIEQTLQRTDMLARAFVHQNPLLTGLRGLSLKWLDLLLPIKQLFAEQAMGLRDDLPLLARGKSLSQQRSEMFDENS
jgi:2-octaprenyl-6-methoxyphenol hydroxylase